MRKRVLRKWGILVGVLLALLLAGGACQKEKPTGGATLLGATQEPGKVLPTTTQIGQCVSKEEAGSVALQHIAATRGIPEAELRVGDVSSVAEYQLTAVRFRKIVVSTGLTPQTAKTFLVVVDCGGKIIPDLEPLRKAEAAAAKAKYGKLSRELYARLEARAPDDLVDIVIWAKVPPGALEAVMRQIHDKYPQAALIPGSVRPRPEASREDFEFVLGVVQPEYNRLEGQVFLEAGRPVAEWIKSKGYAAEASTAAPWVSAKVPKRLVHELELRADVLGLDISQLPTIPLLETSAS